MKFGAVPVAKAEGGVAVHSIRQGGLVLKKGTLIGKDEIAALKAAGIEAIVVARTEPGDVPEDAAAAEIAAAVAGEGVHVERAFTGRANLFAETAGVLVVDKGAVDRLNQVDESITFATLAAYKPVVAGEMIATVKIIPFAVAEKARDAALAVAKAARPLVRIAPYRIRKIGVARQQGDRQDLESDAGTPGASRGHDRRRTARTTRAARARACHGGGARRGR